MAKLKRLYKRPLRPLLSSLSRNILIINLITLIIPIFGFLSIPDHRNELIEAAAQNVRQEAQICADTIALGALRQSADGSEFLDLPSTNGIFARLSQMPSSRGIIFNQENILIYDSRDLHNRLTQPVAAEEPKDIVHISMDRLHMFLDVLENRDRPELYEEARSTDIAYYPHAIDALAGTTRGSEKTHLWRTKDNELAISVAIPVQLSKSVFGAFILIKNYSVEATIREHRLNILQIFFIALSLTITMSFLLSREIARPLSQLATAARRFGQPQHQLSDLHIPILHGPEDEIGILSRALSSMAENLKARISAIEGFAADVAHEIRNPISGISSVLETLEVVNSTEKRKQLTKMAQVELRRIDIMIDDILESSRLDAALMAETREIIDFVQWLALFVETFHNQNPDQELSIVFPSRRVWVAIKTSRLDQVLLNILGNAHDFQPKGVPIQLTCNISTTHATLEIADQGIGIPEQALENIFNRFYSDRPSEDKNIHTGLGLSIVQQTIEGYNGTIVASNRPKPYTGAVFTISLPLVARP